ncbi:MAG: hypothetical protein U1F17_11175 [Burkholderiaceae bacterium]
MTDARDGTAEADWLSHGAALLDAQRKAMVAGNLDELATVNAALADWISRSRRPFAAAGHAPAARADAARMHSTLRANAAVAQRAAAAAQRGLSALLAPSDPVYEADGRKSPATRRGRSTSA